MRRTEAVRETLRGALLDALALVLPVECAGCGIADRALCADCRAALTPRPVVREVDGVGVVTAGLPYAGAAAAVLLAAKEHGRLDVLGALAPLLAAAVSAHPASGDPTGSAALACAVPASRRAYRRRGVDPVRVLLTRSGLPAPRLLSDRGAARTQKALDAGARRRNAQGRMRARRRLDGVAVLLVDDVVTTGATLQEAARAVRAAGGTVLGGAAALSTPRHPASRG